MQAAKTTPVSTKRLGKATIPGLPYENRDGSPLNIDTDYFGKKRSKTNPTAGPFENPDTGTLRLRACLEIRGVTVLNRRLACSACRFHDETGETPVQLGFSKHTLRRVLLPDFPDNRW
jgi:hypothetical protein